VCETVNEPSTDRIGNQNENNWHAARRFEQRRDPGSTIRQDHVRRKRDQFRRVFSRP
jgi:hypothetical protein